VRLINNSRRTKQSQPDVGCQPTTSPSTHLFPQMDRSQNGTQALRSCPGARVNSSSFHPLAPSLQILIANPRLESKLTSKDSSSLQISNRERMAISRRAFSGFPGFKPPTSRPQNLIVTLESKFPVTRRKQTRNQNPNRYKTPLFASRTHFRDEVFAPRMYVHDWLLGPATPPLASWLPRA
jgi:hypothetical protein